MDLNAETLRQLLARGPASSRALQERTGLSQPTISRALMGLGSELVRIGAGRSVIYSLKDARRGLDALPVYQVDALGRLSELGALVPVRPEGFVMRQADGSARHSEGLPWWLADQRPQGFLGRAFALRHAAALGLPASLSDWTDDHVLRALWAQGQDTVGNLLLGPLARERFLTDPLPEPIAASARPARYAELATQAAAGDVPGSSAGGEQPKFTACTQGPGGPRQVLVKFSLADVHPVSARWRDLLCAEHLALRTLADAGVAAAHTCLIDHGPQRFLELERFDRVGLRGRRALHSLGSLDDEFVGNRSAPWPLAVRALVERGVVSAAAEAPVALLYAFGQLIGNTDMHPGNLSFFSAPGESCQLAPAYDMLPMGFAPSAGGALRSELPPLRLAECVAAPVWRQALQLAERYLGALAAGGLSPGFDACLLALAVRLEQAREQLERLA